MENLKQTQTPNPETNPKGMSPRETPSVVESHPFEKNKTIQSLQNLVSNDINSNNHINNGKVYNFTSDNLKTELNHLTTKDIITQISIIQDLLKNVLKENIHYGKIPGCGDKFVLYKAGAEKILFMFRLSPRFRIKQNDLGNGHREYIIITELYHIPTGKFFAQGLGSANTLEAKFRYTKKQTILSENLPKDYKEKKDTYKKQGYEAIKQNNKWYWVKNERVERDNNADNYNTILKMAKKRSLIDATLIATSASDIFTQDIYDLSELDNNINSNKSISS